MNTARHTIINPAAPGWTIQHAALVKARDFIIGFEDDDMQEGIPELLALINAALPEARFTPGQAVLVAPTPGNTDEAVCQGGLATILKCIGPDEFGNEWYEVRIGTRDEIYTHHEIEAAPSEAAP